MRNQRNETAFVKWIDEMTTKEVAKLLRVTTATVNHWRRGHCSPRVEQMKKIKLYSRNKVSTQSIVDTNRN